MGKNGPVDGVSGDAMIVGCRPAGFQIFSIPDFYKSGR
jgi:hypothetical protein